MATPSAPSVEVSLDQPRRLVMDLDALCKAEEATGKNYLRTESWRGISFRDLRALVWACLVSAGETVTLEQAGKIVHPGNFMLLVDELRGLFFGAMPAAVNGGEGDSSRPPVDESSTSSPSGQSAESTSD